LYNHHHRALKYSLNLIYINMTFFESFKLNSIKLKDYIYSLEMDFDLWERNIKKIKTISKFLFQFI